MSLESDLKKCDKLVEKAKKAGEEEKKLMEDIKNRVKTGKETTGDKIRDFVIYVNGWTSNDVESAYKLLDEKLKNKAGKLLLVVDETTEEKDLLEKHYMAHDDEDEKCGFMPPPKHRVTTATLRLGVLLEDYLSFNLETQKFAFPVGKHALQFDKGRGWKIVEENISFHAYEIFLLDEKLQKEQKKHDIFSFLHGTSRAEKLSVYLDEEVEKYFAEPKIDPEDCFSELKSQKMDLSYIAALKLLNLEVPKKFLDAQDKKREDAKKRALDDIEHVLEEKPEPAYWNAACDHMRAALDCAISLGMHNDESTMPGKQKGTTINVKEYITDLCKQYGVAVPK